MKKRSSLKFTLFLLIGGLFITLIGVFFRINTFGVIISRFFIILGIVAELLGAVRIIKKYLF